MGTKTQGFFGKHEQYSLLMSCVSTDGFRADGEQAVLGKHQGTWELGLTVSSGNMKG